ncbi:phosphopantetheine-binding protein, partial [Amycolatopsis sp. NPDC049252]|uniref:phosphopantetheine-binding protein n=1 Tax=Amycolatopsis sp. NPDC049252 TaxID=3363933 RepID=UPI0037186138
DYMIPAAFVQLESLPLTPNGKLDRKAMPEPDFEAAAAYRAPETPLQEALCAIFGSVLEVPQVGIDDSFFDLGGQSLQAMRLLNRMKTDLDVDLLINVLFDKPTVAELAEHIDGAAAAAA